jgi:arylsulfatase A-like enzyme
MARKPNILFLMTDQMQGRVLDPKHPCLTPHLDRLADRGMRFSHAYTPNAVCSPARASLMTGLLPHSHGVLEVTHVVDDDQCCLRTDKPHWAQRLVQLGYHTGYFGKWHVERTDEPEPFGWQVNGVTSGSLYRQHQNQLRGKQRPEPKHALAHYIDHPPGYRRNLLYAVTHQPPHTRGMGVTTSLAEGFLQEVLFEETPWCCFVSVSEPHDPFVCEQKTFDLYDVEALELPPNLHDDLTDRPGLYRKASAAFAQMTEQEHREAAACYYASITEIDQTFGRLIELVGQAGALDNTIVIFTSDHGEFLGAHGLYCKNVSGFEEAYNIPMVMAGPGIASGVVSDARVGLHDLCPTILDLVGAEPLSEPDSRSFAPLLSDPALAVSYRKGYAEYHGGRYRLTQRLYWEGDWKLIFNGFDYDELYNLSHDPFEMHNLATDPAHQSRLQDMLAAIWRRVRDTGDHALWNSHYFGLRIAPFGPGIAGDHRW